MRKNQRLTETALGERTVERLTCVFTLIHGFKIICYHMVIRDLKGHSPSAEWHFSTEESSSSVCEADKHVDSLHNAMQEGKSMNKISISVTFILKLEQHIWILEKMLIFGRISHKISVHNFSAFAQTCSSYLDFIFMNVLEMKTNKCGGMAYDFECLKLPFT